MNATLKGRVERLERGRHGKGLDFIFVILDAEGEGARLCIPGNDTPAGHYGSRAEAEVEVRRQYPRAGILAVDASLWEATD
jgi:hypothetical protein